MHNPDFLRVRCMNRILFLRAVVGIQPGQPLPLDRAVPPDVIRSQKLFRFSSLSSEW